MRASCTLLTALLMCSGCGGGGGKSSCNPDTYPDDCLTTEGCDAITKKCEAAKSCQSDDDCAGYSCTISQVCRRNCRGQAGPDDSLCAAGYLCTAATLTCDRATDCDPAEGTSACNGFICDPATMMCVLGASCITDDDCGTYYCDPSAGCYTSCLDFSECGAAYTCDAFTNRCS